VRDLRTETVSTVPDSITIENSDPRGYTRIAALAIVVVGALFYLNSFQGSFVFDEHDWIIDNPHIRHLWPPWQALFAPENVGRPLVGLSNAINYWISGLNPWSYHLLNLMIHIAAALALYGIVRRTLLTERLKERFGKDSNALALVVALIWVVHPIQTQSVTYIMQRCESMMGMFYLVCLYCSIRSYDSVRKGLWYAAAIAACAAGMLSKQVMVTAPLVVLLYDVVFITQALRETLRRRWPLYIGLAATWAVLAATMVAAPASLTAGFAVKTISSWAYFKSELGVIVYYLRLSLWPSPLCLDYFGWPVAKTSREVIPYAIVLTGLGVATVWALVRRRPEGFLGAWFFLILSVTSSVMPIDDLVFEHRMYLPLAAVAAFVVVGCYALGARLKTRMPLLFGSQSLDSGRIAVALATLVIVALGFATARRNIDYSSEVVMWNDVVKKRPDNPRGHSNLGTALAELGKNDKAMEEFREALRIDPAFEPAHANLGLALFRDGKPAEARAELLDAISLNTRDSNAHCNLGRVLSALGQTNEAVDEFTRAVRINPYFAEAYSNLGTAFVELGKMDNATQEFREALSIDPGFEPAHCNLGMALYFDGRLAEAKTQLLDAISLNPSDSTAHCDLGRVLSDKGQTNEAVDEFERAVRINPDFAEAHLRLGYELEKSGRDTDAKEQYALALQLRPEWVGKVSTHLAGLK
jgi:Flp pilus assembly protein TadD